jgi:hypothetical protein
MTVARAYEEIIEFLAAGTTPRSLAAFRPSEGSRERVAELIRREKSGELDDEERAELEHYLDLEHLMRLAKARARRHLSG